MQAAVAQAKIQAPPAPRGPAPHVQAAITRAAQAQVRPSQPVQAKAPAPARLPAPHVQRAVAPPVQPAPPWAPVVQPMKRTLEIAKEEDEKIIRELKSFKKAPPSLLSFDPESFDFGFSSFSFSPITPIQSIVSTYDPTTPELSELSQSAQNLFAYTGTEGLTDQRTVKIFDVKGLTFKTRSTGTVHAAVQIDHLTPMIVSSGGYGTPTPVVRKWMKNLTWQDEQEDLNTGFTSPLIKDKLIKFTIPKKKNGHRWSAHAEVNAYRELYRLYQNNQLTPSSIKKFRMATNIAHCAECWWAANALFQKLGIDVGKIETSSPTGNRLFSQWTEPWQGFYKELGMSSSPFRTNKGKLQQGFKTKKPSDPKALNKLQNVVIFK